MKPWLLAAKLLTREWRAGELRILMAALLIAVTCMTSVNLFAERIGRAMSWQASDLLGGDLGLTSANPIPENWLAHAKDSHISTTEVLIFLSMLSANHQLQLANVRAVDSAYPLRGKIKITDQLDGVGQITHSIPAPNTIWLEASLLALLHIQLGDSITLGAANFKVTHILHYQPDSLGGTFSFSPYAMMNIADVPKTAVIQPGSRIEYIALFAGNSRQLSQFSVWIKPQLSPGQKLIGANENHPSLQTTLERVQHYLGLGSLISVILAGVALAVALKRFTYRHYDMVALMRCYGASGPQVVMIYLFLLLYVGLFSILLACVMGYFAQDVLQKMLATLIQMQLPAATLSGIWFSIVAGLWILLAFGLPPLWQLTRVSPLQVLRRDLFPLPVSSIWLYLSGLIAISALIIWYVQDLKLAWIILTGCVSACLLFLLGAWGLITLIRRAHQKVGVAWTYGFFNLGRRWQSSVLQITAFGFTLMVLLLLLIVRHDLLAAWQHELPPDAPNYFVINIAPDQIAPIKEMLVQYQIHGEQIFPMVRGRLYQLNQRPINRDDESLKRELNLSWTDTLPRNNQITSGRWWEKGDAHVISVEEGLANRLGLKLGDDLSFRIGARSITAKIISLRQLNWSSMQPNFYVLFPPDVLTDYPSTYITSFYLPEKKSNIPLNAFIQRFPNLTIINVAEVLKQVQNLLTQAGNAIQYLFFFALLAGLVVLYACIYATLDQRLFEGAILRALGASHYQLLTALIAEFVILGALAGLLAACVANGIGMALGHWLFSLDLHFNGELLLIGVVAGACMVGVMGTFATRAILQQSPLLTMRENY